jgi:hypothetical protein
MIKNKTKDGLFHTTHIITCIILVILFWAYLSYFILFILFWAYLLLFYFSYFGHIFFLSHFVFFLDPLFSVLGGVQKCGFFFTGRNLVAVQNCAQSASKSIAPGASKSTASSAS